MKRRNSKKKKDSEPEKKFKDDIDQALHEIQLMEKESQSKSNTNSLRSKRPSKKYKKAPSNEKETTPEAEPQNEDKKVAVQLSVRVANMKEPSDDEDDDEEIQCLVEEPVKKVQSSPVSPPKVVSSPDPKPYKPIPSPYKEEAPVKRSLEGTIKPEAKLAEEPPKSPAAGIALPIT